MSVHDRTKALIKFGQTDGIKAIPTNLPKYNEYLYGIRQGTMITLMAESSVGKTSFARDKYVDAPFEYYKSVNDPNKFDIEIIDFSLEISAEANRASSLSRKIYLDYGRVVPMARIFGWSGKFDQDIQTIIDSYDDYFAEMESKMVIIDGEISPDFFHDVLFDVAKRNGKFAKEGKTIGESSGYVANNPNKYFIVIFDTINLVETTKEFNTIKAAIDRISRISVLFRNVCRFTMIELQQISAELSSTDRSRFGKTVPIMRDAEDSRRPTKDSNIVLALYDPIPHLKEENPIFMGYDISILKSWFKSLHILKHREGVRNKVIPLKSHGAIPYFEQLPEAILMTQRDYELATKH